MNNFAFTGNLGRDPELKYTQSGTAVCNFSVAAQSGWGDNKKTFWAACTAWGKQAELVAEYLKKGSKVGIVGEVSEDEYEKDGATIRRTKITVRNVDFLDPKGGVKSDTHGSNDSQNRAPDDDDDDIPF